MKKQLQTALFWAGILLTAQAPHAAMPWDAVLPETGAGESTAVKFNGLVEAGFAPDGGAERLIIKVIASAQTEIRMLAYTITSPEIIDALVAAKQRGVDVQVTVDYRSSITEDNRNRSRHALNLLSKAKIPVQTVAAWPTQHSKIIIVDRRHVQTGTANYGSGNRNSENVLVIWDSPELATLHLSHWASRNAKGEGYRPVN